MKFTDTPPRKVFYKRLKNTGFLIQRIYGDPNHADYLIKTTGFYNGEPMEGFRFVKKDEIEFIHWWDRLLERLVYRFRYLWLT